MLNKIIDTEGFNAVVKGKYGYVIFNKNDTYIGKSIGKYGEYLEHEASLFKQLCTEKDIVIDVGANIGTHTLIFSKLVGSHGKVHAYEPQPIIFQTLCGNMAINSIQNVECYQTAAYSTTGDARMPNPNPSIEFNFGALGIDNCNDGNQISMVKLDDTLKLDRLNLMKIKASGAECEVIEGAQGLIERHKPRLYVQNDREEKSKQLLAYLQRMGYKMFWHYPTYFNLKNYALDEDNIYSNQTAVNMLCIHTSDSVCVDGFEAVSNF